LFKCKSEAYRLTTLPSILRFQGEWRLPGIGRVEGARAPRWWALRRLVFAMRGTSEREVLDRWQDLQRICKLSGAFVPTNCEGNDMINVPRLAGFDLLIAGCACAFPF